MKEMKSLLALAIVCALAGGTVFAQATTSVGPVIFSDGARPLGALPASVADTVLYSQNDNASGSGPVCQDFETVNDSFDSEGADDFVVPSDASWQINSVTATGLYSASGGPAAAVNLTIFNDNAGTPGDPACSYPLQTPTDTAGTFVFTLPFPCILSSGTYWIDVQARMDFSPNGEWGWEARTVQSNAAALWRNPGNGFDTGCTNFSPMAACLDLSAPDFMFSLSGQVLIITPNALLVDTTGDGNLNGVLEIGEMATIAPSWTNNGADAFALAGSATLTGPAGPTYTLNDSMAAYGLIASGATANCETATTNCYALTITGTRPAQHFDVVLTEQPGEEFSLTEAAGLPPQVWTLHVGESFNDVGTGNQFYKYIETIFHNGITGGCAGGGYCPDNSVTRAQMAVFLLKSKLGSSYMPPACTGTVFADVPCTGGPFDPWIEDLKTRSLSGGCGGGDFCPNDPVTRAQMAVFLLKASLGAPYVPPACTGTVFADVPCTGGQFDPWIEDLHKRGITGGCGGGDFCPNSPNARGQMAVFLTKAFGLVLYGPVF
jgi:S-layer homology domain